MLGASAALAAIGCLDGSLTTSTARSAPIAADTTPIGELVLRQSSGPTTGPGGTLDLLYRNTTTRTFEAIGLAVAQSTAAVPGACAPPSYPFRDTVLTALPPASERTVATGSFPTTLTVFVTRAVQAGMSLTNSLAGRWAGTLTEWRAGAPTVRNAVAVSRSSGLLLAQAVAGGDTLVFELRLALPRPLAYSAFPSTCQGTYTADAALAMVRFDADTLDVRAPALPTAFSDGSVTLPDSFRLVLGRRP